MRSIFLRLANLPIFFLLGCFFVSIQSSFFISFPLNWLQPDLLLPLVIWAGLRRGFTEGGFFSLLIGYLAELHSSSPNGALLTCYMTIFLIARLTSRVFVIPDIQAWSHLTTIASIFWKGTNLLVLATLEKAGTQWQQTLFHLLPCAAMTGLFSIGIYRLLNYIDRITHKNARLEQKLIDDINLIENEGL